jgi:hypothetical protein
MTRQDSREVYFELRTVQVSLDLTRDQRYTCFDQTPYNAFLCMHRSSGGKCRPSVRRSTDVYSTSSAAAFATHDYGGASRQSYAAVMLLPQRGDVIIVQCVTYT